MKRPASFSGRSQGGRGRVATFRSSSGLPVRTAASHALPPPGQAVPGQAGGEMQALLRQLLGRNLSLRVGEAVQTGRLIRLDPLVLVDQAGREIFVRYEEIVSVDY